MTLLPFTTGIEIETGPGLVERSLLPQSWTPGEDISCGLEFTSGIIKDLPSLVNEVESVCKVLKQSVNLVPKTGLHVHVGFGQIRDFSAKYRLFRFVSHYEQLFFNMLPPLPERASYCLPISRTLWTDMQNGKGFDCWKAENLPRYWWFNGKAMHKYGTVEFRLMNGTLEAKEIIGWACLLQCIFNATVNLEVKVDWNPPISYDMDTFLSDARVESNSALCEFATEFVQSKYNLCNA